MSPIYITTLWTTAIPAGRNDDDDDGDDIINLVAESRAAYKGHIIKLLFERCCFGTSWLTQMENTFQHASSKLYQSKSSEFRR